MDPLSKGAGGGRVRRSTNVWKPGGNALQLNDFSQTDQKLL